MKISVEGFHMTKVFPFVCAIFARVTWLHFSLLSKLLQVYLQYTSEYMKGPMYWHPDKMWPSCRFCGLKSAIVVAVKPEKSQTALLNRTII